MSGLGLSMQDLVAAYTIAAETHGRATEAGEHDVANISHDKVTAIHRELRARGLDALQNLLPLLSHPEPGVRMWASAHTLEFAAKDAEPVLAALARTPRSLLGFLRGHDVEAVAQRIAAISMIIQCTSLPGGGPPSPKGSVL